jgi:membrane-bound metal-dependent hydrolase YbcI (DUF457 family)
VDTHSLVAASLWSLPALFVYRLMARERRWTPGVVVGGAVFSHWVLDFIVRRQDLPLYDNSAKVGLGLWNVAPLAFGLEAVLLFGVMYLYFRSGLVRRLPTAVSGILMLVVQAYVFFGPPRGSDKAAAATALLAYVVFAFVIGVLERRKDHRTPSLEGQ